MASNLTECLTKVNQLSVLHTRIKQKWIPGKIQKATGSVDNAAVALVTN